MAASDRTSRFGQTRSLSGRQGEGDIDGCSSGPEGLGEGVAER